MAAYVLARSAATPDKTALAVLGLNHAQNWSYARLTSAVLGTATGLLRAGFTPGDRLLMRLGNTVDFPIAYLGAIAAGLVPVPTSTQLTAPEVATIANVINPVATLHDPDVSGARWAAKILTLDDLKAMRDLPPAKWHMGDPNRPAYIIFTSGTSGTPRAVVHAHRAIWARRMMHRGWYDLRNTDRLLHAGAFNWTYTLGTGLMDPWSVGATSLIAEPGLEPHHIPILLNRYDASLFAAAPGVFRKILGASAPLDLPRLRHAFSAGEKLSEDLRSKWRDATGTEIYEAYGMSECSTFISGSPDCPAHAGHLGRPQPGRHVAIIGDHGPVRYGDEGIIAVHRDDPGLMLGYLNAPDDTAARMRGDWFLTGDHGTMDGAGNITFLGRRDDMMNAGGYRVSPLEVEAVLATHPGITQCAVTDIEVKHDTRLIMAFYTGAPDISQDALRAFAAARLARYKCPRNFYHVETLPTGPNGKLLRRELRPIYEALNGHT